MFLAKGLRRGGIWELHGEYFVPILIAYKFRMIVMHLVDNQIAYLKSGQIITLFRYFEISIFRYKFVNRTKVLYNCKFK